MLIDTNIFLEVQLNQQKAQEASEILEAVSKNIIQAYVTDFTIDSIVLIMEHYNKSPAEIKQFLVSLLAYEGLDFYQLSIFDKIKATEYMNSLHLDFDDACMYQAMRALKITTIASFDTDFDKISSIKRLVSLT